MRTPCRQHSIRTVRFYPNSPISPAQPALNSSISILPIHFRALSTPLISRQQQFPDAKVCSFKSNVSFQTFERQLVERDYVRMKSVFLVVRTLQCSGKPKTESDTASNGNSTMLDAQQNRQQHSETATVDSDPEQRCNVGLRNRNTSPTNCRQTKTGHRRS